MYAAFAFNRRGSYTCNILHHKTKVSQYQKFLEKSPVSPFIVNVHILWLITRNVMHTKCVQVAKLKTGVTPGHLAVSRAKPPFSNHLLWLCGFPKSPTCNMISYAGKMIHCKASTSLRRIHKIRTNIHSSNKNHGYLEERSTKNNLQLTPFYARSQLTGIMLFLTEAYVLLCGAGDRTETCDVSNRSYPVSHSTLQRKWHASSNLGT